MEVEEEVERVGAVERKCVDLVWIVRVVVETF